MDTGVKSSTKSDTGGAYRFNNILVGRYTVTATAPGFTTTSLKDLAVELNKATTANIKVEVGSVATAVDVMEAATTIDTTTAQVANNFETRMAAEIPSSANPNGGVLNLSLLGAGIHSGAGGVGVGIGPSVGGQRPRNNSFNIEGVDNNRKDVTGPVLSIPKLTRSPSSPFSRTSSAPSTATPPGASSTPSCAAAPIRYTGSCTTTCRIAI